MSITNKKSNNFWLKLKKTPSNSPHSAVAQGRLFRKGVGARQPILALAPMAGITDSAFRQICKKYGADVVYTEMISADGLHYDSKKTLAMLDFDKSERPVVIQLFGKDPSKFTKAAELAQQAGYSGIDINFGCPAKKVAGHGGGVTLMRDLNKCRQIIEAVLAGTTLPVSVKLRTSIKKGAETMTALDFIKTVIDLPIAAYMIHGRPYENPFAAEIDYEMIRVCVKFIKTKNPQIVVLGNGGINTPEDAKKMMELTGVDGVGLARGLYGRPYLFDQIKKYFQTGRIPEYDKKKVKQAILLHAKLAARTKDVHGLVELRKHLLWYVKGWPNAKDLRSELVKVENLKQVKEILKTA